MTADDFWNELLPPLAEAYDSDDRRPDADIGPLFSETVGVVRECLATKVAEGSLVPVEGTHHYRLTTEGYEKYRRRVHFLRKFSTIAIR